MQHVADDVAGQPALEQPKPQPVNVLSEIQALIQQGDYAAIKAERDRLKPEVRRLNGLLTNGTITRDEQITLQRLKSDRCALLRWMDAHPELAPAKPADA